MSLMHILASLVIRAIPSPFAVVLLFPFPYAVVLSMNAAHAAEHVVLQSAFIRLKLQVVIIQYILAPRALSLFPFQYFLQRPA